MRNLALLRRLRTRRLPRYGGISDKKPGICQSENCAQKIPLPSSLLQTDEIFELRARILAPIRVIEVLAGNTEVRRDDVWYELRPGQQLQKLDSGAWDVNDRDESSSKAHNMRLIEHGNISAVRDLFEVDHQILL